MTMEKITIMAVDDEPLNLDLLEEFLEDGGYQVVCCKTAKDALAMLARAPDAIDIILLDRMMPEMNGMEMLEALREQPTLKDIPVIMQTAAATTQQALEGIRAGVYYYLTKPFDEETLLAVVDGAVSHLRKQRGFRQEIQREMLLLDTLVAGTFQVRTLEQAKKLALLLGCLCPDAQRASYGFAELLVNAVEHGNLELGWDEKGKLLAIGETAWLEEIQRRLQLPEYRDKYVEVRCERSNGSLEVRIEDQGKGFDWKSHTAMSAHHATGRHGRGIALARHSLDYFEYQGNGNTAICRVEIPQHFIS